MPGTDDVEDLFDDEDDEDDDDLLIGENDCDDECPDCGFDIDDCQCEDEEEDYE